MRFKIGLKSFTSKTHSKNNYDVNVSNPNMTYLKKRWVWKRDTSNQIQFDHFHFYLNIKSNFYKKNINKPKRY